LPTWPIADDEVLVLVMAAGVNYNGVWAGLRTPISPIDGHKNPYHIAGSDASGIVWKVGAKVKRWKVGDEIIIHCNQTTATTTSATAAIRCCRPRSASGATKRRRIVCAVLPRGQSRQLMRSPRTDLGRVACYTSRSRPPIACCSGQRAAHAQAGDTCCVGRLRRLGVFGLQLVAASARTQSRSSRMRRKMEYVFNLGAKGAINRKESREGPDAPGEHAEYNTWLKEARQFGKAIWRSPAARR